MPFESITDEKIQELLAMPKNVTNPGMRSKKKEGISQLNYNVHAPDSDEYFVLFTRQNLHEGMEDDFSCGLRWLAPNGESLTLTRYNGPHVHKNRLEGTKFDSATHIHKASAKYIQANRKAEGFAVTTDNFFSLEGALHCLVTDCNISGLNTEPDDTSQIKLF